MNDTDMYKVGILCGFWYERTPHGFYYSLSRDMIENECKINGSTTSRGVSRRANASQKLPSVAHETSKKR